MPSQGRRSAGAAIWPGSAPTRRRAPRTGPTPRPARRGRGATGRVRRPSHRCLERVLVRCHARLLPDRTASPVVQARRHPRAGDSLQATAAALLAALRGRPTFERGYAADCPRGTPPAALNRLVDPHEQRAVATAPLTTPVLRLADEPATRGVPERRARRAVPRRVPAHACERVLVRADAVIDVPVSEAAIYPLEANEPLAAVTHTQVLAADEQVARVAAPLRAPPDGLRVQLAVGLVILVGGPRVARRR